MNRNLQILSGMLLFLFLVGGALAIELGQMNASPKWWAAPQGELDEEFEDSLYYHEFTNGIVWYQTTNYYAAVRFSVPSDFTIQGFRFLASSPLTLDACEVRLYQDNNGAIGTLIGQVWDGPATSIIELDGGWNPPPPGWIELLLDEEDYVDIATGDDFWVVVGPMPGDDEWQLVMDGETAVPGNRNKIGSNLNGITQNAAFNHILHVGGEYAGDFVDLKSYSLFNDIQKFHFGIGEEVNFSARFFNQGTSDSPAGTVTFTVSDTGGNEIWTNQADSRVIEPLSVDTAMVTATEAWIPDSLGYFIASATISIDGEDITDNNTYLLFQGVIDEASWYYYDDDSFEVNMNPQTGQGWGVSFYPLSYPAMIAEMSFYSEDPQDATDLRVYTIDGNGENQVWNYTGALVAGWNTFAIEDLVNFPEGININEGFFIGGYVDAGHVFHADSNPPNAAANPDMPAVSSSIVDNVNYIDTAGNWGVRARMGQGVAPDLVFTPGENLEYGPVPLGTTATQSISVENQGDGAGQVTNMRIGQFADQFMILNDLPVDIPAGQTVDIFIEWTPVNEGQLNSVMIVDHNDVSEPPANPLMIFISGGGVGVRENPAEVPADYFLEQNFPNPFNPSTGIRFGVKESGQVNLTVFNLMGQQVATLVDQKLKAGVHEVTFNAESLSSGIYFYSLEVNGYTSMKKMAFIR